MSRLLIVSNRLPVSVERRKGKLHFKGSVGGVATGLGSYHKSHESLWVGWADVPGRLDSLERKRIASELRAEHQCVPVFLTTEDVRGFYHGFSNKTLWPLFHQFTQYAEFDASTWAVYERANRKFRDTVLEVAEPGDIIWVQDYQLMLLPQMLREKLPDAAIGFFLHIPFPTVEVFRMLPQRREVLDGLLGADLIGFHTYDYVRYFLGTARRLAGTEDQSGRITVDGHQLLVDAFPMGIDFDRYAEGIDVPGAKREATRVRERTRSRKIILSVDRLDYTKGIPDRLRAFAAFLERHPEWRDKVTLIAVAVPSRTRVEHYKALKREVDELVGSINGTYSTIEWTPVRYLYRSLPFNTLVGMYAVADVALVTPLRDGMNLIAKEYVAAHAGREGVLVLSEMAGAARELSEAVQVNPFDLDGMVDAIHRALTMPAEEQIQRNKAMVQRLKRYTVQRWAEDFLGRLEEVKGAQAELEARLLDRPAQERMLERFSTARHRLLVLDYDGTLTAFSDDPAAVRPDDWLLETLGELAGSQHTEVVVVSGRDRHTLGEWFAGLPLDLVAEHGVWVRSNGEDWLTIEPMNDEWKSRIRPVLEAFTDRTPGSFVEEKDFSLVWHYRAVDRRLAETRVGELKETLVSLVGDYDLAVTEGNRVIEVRAAGVNKGRAAYRWMCRDDLDFVFFAGDDHTDEDVFEVAPEGSWTVKVGLGPTRAAYSVRHPRELRALLERMAGDGG
ncbi:MAG: bifunctional alpha,alpha-trehalose-phosphate synthase (UDP-forming)/trehalose-phosphatase [Coriobacteriia bacterium]|nr:bifunctional alpha,alpha-trehalose-phosphate synthase (UDP-forming)/trehalose-phosphatase [Coriobacteriia bacterium]